MHNAPDHHIHNRYGYITTWVISPPVKHHWGIWLNHYSDVIMGTMATQITSFTIVYSTFIQTQIKKKYQTSASLAFVRGLHRGPVNSPHKWSETRKMSPFDDVIMFLVLKSEYSGISQYHGRWCYGSLRRQATNNHGIYCADQCFPLVQHFNYLYISTFWEERNCKTNRFREWIKDDKVTGEFPAQRLVTRIFDIFFDLRLNKLMSKQWSGWWFETPSRPLWRHCNDNLGLHWWDVLPAWACVCACTRVFANTLWIDAAFRGYRAWRLSLLMTFSWDITRGKYMLNRTFLCTTVTSTLTSNYAELPSGPFY